jgi:ADP-ribose pyrophosphatase YjhB (NUDIX family)
MKIAKKSKKHRTVVVIFREKTPLWDKILLGYSMNRFCAGMLIPPGGHIEKGEDMFATAVHEGTDETGLVPDPSSMRHVGTFEVRFLDGTLVHMEFIEVRKWGGKLKSFPSMDFSHMSFMDVGKIPWHDMPPGDAGPILDLLQGFFVKSKIWCGKNRREFLAGKSTKHLMD